jgi:hypothetical protein
VIEDVDRITERGADALLKSIEEPAARTVSILWAPTVDDVAARVRSRCRLLTLQTPSIPGVAQLLGARDGIAPERAAEGCAASQRRPAIPLPTWQSHETAQRLRAGCDRSRPPLAFGECGTFRTLVATSPQVAMVGSQEERRVAK